MKKLGAILLTLALVVGLSIPMAIPVAASPGPGLVGLWHLDEGIGSTASDSSGAGNDGTLSGGKFGNALSFDGVDDYVEVPHSTSLDITSAITVEGWIKLASFSQQSTVAGKWRNLGTNNRGYLLTVDTSGKPRFYISTDGSNYPVAIASTALLLDTWYHLAGTYDGTNIKLYVNDVLVGTTAQTGSIFSNSEPLLIGATDGWGGTLRKFTNGIIDEARISNVARTSFNLALPPSADTDTVALWRLDESVGSTAYDETANDNDGTISEASWAGPTWTSGMFDDALSFDGVDDYVNCGDKTDFEFSGDFSVEAWVKHSATSNQVYVSKWTGSGGGSQWWLGFYNNKACFGVYGTGGSKLAWGTYVADGGWHHVVGVRSGTDIYIYQDGAQKGSATGSAGAAGGNVAPLTLGDYNGSSGTWPFNGFIDEVRIWDTAYPGLEVSADPTSDYNPVTFEHEITATVDPVLPDGATVGLEVTAGPNVGKTDIGETDASGEVTLSYTDTMSSTTGATETDTIRIWVDRNWNDSYDSGIDFATTVTKDWVKLASLTQLAAYNPVGNDHEVEATISSAVDGITVWFEVSGANSASGSEETDDGVASFSYTGTNPGTDTITAYFDTDGSGHWDDEPEEPSLTVTKYWLEHYVTGGGIIREGKGKNAAKITFGGTVGYDLSGDEVGQWQIVFHNVNNNDLDKGKFHSTEIIYIDFKDYPALPDPSPPEADVNYVRFDVLGKFNGEDGWKIRVNATDFGEGNKTEPDEIRIRLWNGNSLVYDSYEHGDAGGGDFPDESFHVRTDLDGGNIQIHPPALP